MHLQRSPKCSKWNNVTTNERLAKESDFVHAQSHVADNETNVMGDGAYDISDSGLL